MRRMIGCLVVLGVLAGLGAAGAAAAMSWWHQRAIPRYLTATVSRGKVETVVNSTGTIKPVRTVAVGAFTSGPIIKVAVEFNSRVKKGDLLARIDPKLARAALNRDTAALESQKAELGRIEAQLKQAENNEKRAKKLQAVNKDYISDADMDQYFYARLALEAQIRLAKASIQQAEANLENSKANLEYTEIVSPEDGIVIDRKVDPGQTVAASFQTPELFTIAPEMDRHIYVFASVDEADVGFIRAAKERQQVVKFTVDAYPGELFPGRVDHIRMNSTTTQNVVTYPVVIEAPNPDLKLMPGMTANISFQIEAKESVLRVPVAALRFIPLPNQVRPEDKALLQAVAVSTAADAGARGSADQKAEQARKRQHRQVWVQDGQLLRAVPVILGLIDPQYAELVGGELTEGQALVTGTESALEAR